MSKKTLDETQELKVFNLTAKKASVRLFKIYYMIKIHLK